MDMNINRSMIERWYVYTALTKLVNKSVEVNANDNNIIRLVNKDDFIHSAKNAYELTTVQIHSDDLKKTVAVMCLYLVTGFF